MLVYTPHITPRIEYILQYFNEKLMDNAVVTNDIEQYHSYTGEKLNYSNERIGSNELFICPAGLLHQQDIRKQYIKCFEWRNSKAFYQTNDDIGFDIFSAVFYCISRYEEYAEHEPDEYGRYAHWNSLAWKEGFLNKPLVDIWLMEFRKILKLKFPPLNIHHPQFAFLPTYDIDIAWSYLHKGFWRNIGAALNKPATIGQRLQVLQGRRADPFDCYNWLNQLHQKHQTAPIYFFLVAKERGGLDKNISPMKKALQQLIREVKQHATVGLHPSVHSNTAKECLIKEKTLLEQVTQSAITKSRHHYLQLHIPHSYRELMTAGISNDYTMGYGTVNGFRASTSNSFLWYDLEKEETTPLRIHPFAFMEANNFYELHQSPDEAFTELKQLYNELKAVNGTLVTVFHNHFLGTGEMFSGWKEMYEELVGLVEADGSI
jgi:hypothetical protein